MVTAVMHAARLLAAQADIALETLALAIGLALAATRSTARLGALDAAILAGEAGQALALAPAHVGSSTEGLLGGLAFTATRAVILASDDESDLGRSLLVHLSTVGAEVTLLADAVRSSVLRALLVAVLESGAGIRADTVARAVVGAPLARAVDAVVAASALTDTSAVLGFRAEAMVRALVGAQGLDVAVSAGPALGALAVSGSVSLSGLELTVLAVRGTHVERSDCLDGVAAVLEGSITTSDRVEGLAHADERQVRVSGTRTSHGGEIKLNPGVGCGIEGLEASIALLLEEVATARDDDDVLADSGVNLLADVLALHRKLSSSDGGLRYSLASLLSSCDSLLVLLLEVRLRNLLDNGLQDGLVEADDAGGRDSKSGVESARLGGSGSLLGLLLNLGPSPGLGIQHVHVVVHRASIHTTIDIDLMSDGDGGVALASRGSIACGVGLHPVKLLVARDASDVDVVDGVEETVI